MMKYTALAVVFMLVCTAIGARGGPRVARLPVTAVLAIVMVAAQFAVLMIR